MSIFNGDSRSAQGSRHSSLADIERGNSFLAPRHEATITRYSPLANQSGSMLAYLGVQTPSGMIIDPCKLMVSSSGHHWIALPSQKQVDRDGNPVLDQNGKQRYHQIVDFASPDARERFQQLVLDALRREHPGAFQ